MQVQINKFGVIAIVAVLFISVIAVFFSTNETEAQNTAAIPPSKPSEAQTSWIKRCNEDETRCEIFQSIFVTQNDETNRLLEIVVGKADDGANMVAVTAPLGIQLENGITLDTNPEDDQAVLLPVKTCVPSGCLAVGRVEDTLVNDMQVWDVMSVFFNQQDGRRIEVKLSLNGFNAAFVQL